MDMKFSQPRSLKNRLIHNYLVVIIVPIFILTVVIIGLFLQMMILNSIHVAQGSNEQILKSVDNALDSLVLLSSYPALDPDTIEILKKNYATYGSLSLWEQINDANQMDKKLSIHIYHMSNLINSVFLIPENSKYISYNILGYYDSKYDYKKSHWYRRILEAKGHVVIIGKHIDYMNALQPSTITVGRSIIDPTNDKLLGVILINVNESKFTDLWKNVNVTPNSFTVVKDESNHMIHQKDIPVSDNNFDYITKALSSKSGKSNIIFTPLNRKMYLAICSKPGEYNWEAVTIIPIFELFTSTILILFLIIVTVFILIIIVIRVSTNIANRITTPIEQLNNTIRAIEQGNLTIQAAEGTDEIGMLAKSFNKMTTNIRNLIDQIHTEEKEKRNAELLALQSQINPHFLYNTLNSIKVMAQIQGAIGVAGTLESLISFLRFCTKNKDELITLAGEAKIAQNYVAIMNFRYLNKITYRCNIPDNLKNYLTIRFLLQPMIENSIVHGYDLSSSKAIISVSAWEEDNFIVIRVADNGIGIDSERIDSILNGKLESTKNRTTSIGLYNVNQRIQMTFGTQYGLCMKSKPGFYTVIETKLPMIAKEEELTDGNNKDFDSRR